MSRNPHEPTPESRAQVEALCSFGTPEPDIATFIGIDPKTLRKYYRAELDRAVVKANAAVAQSLFNTATKGEGASKVTAAIFWLKTRARWKETSVHEVSGLNGAPIAQTVTHDLSGLGLEDLRALEGILAKADPKP